MRGHKGRWNFRSAMTIAAMVALILAAVVPWRSEVMLPAVFRAERQADIFSIEPGRIVTMPEREGQVNGGDALFALESPDLAYSVAKASREIARLRAQAAMESVDPETLSQLPVTLSELEGAAADLRSLEARSRDLVIRAPFSGRVTELPEYLRLRSSVAKREPLALLVDPSSTVIEAYVSEADYVRIKAGAEARFLPEDLGEPIPATVETIDTAAVKELRRADLASVHGGLIPTRSDGRDHLIPENAVYRVILRPVGDVAPGERERRGTVAVTAERTSWAARVLRTAQGIVVRESGW